MRITGAALALLAAGQLLVAGCGAADVQTTEPAATATGRPGAWPDPRPPAAASCVSLYPDRLTRHPNAFDATVTAVRVGAYVHDAGASPATVELTVHETFTGPERSAVTMKTWDFMLPRKPQSAVGLRVLLAAGETLDVKGCGYSRPYDAGDAAEWRAAFAGNRRP
jgi:hypothetical protein